MSSFFTYVFNGVSLGSVYAIIALGYTMVYGIAKMLNFAHGDVIMIGGYVLFTSIYGGGINPFIEINYDESIMRIDNIDFVKDFTKGISISLKT